MKKLLLIFMLLASVCDASTLAKVLEIKADVDAIKQVLTERNIPFTGLSNIANSLDSSLLPIYSGGDGTASDPFQIATASHFLAIGSGDTVAGASGNWDMDKHYRQVADIDFDGIAFTPVGHVAGSGFTAFTGSYDGNGCKISNVSFAAASSRRLGLFAAIEGGRVENLGLKNLAISGEAFVGGVCGDAAGVDISNIYVSGSTLSASHASTSLGGLIGATTGGTINDITNSYVFNTALNSTSGTKLTGGLVGVLIASPEGHQTTTIKDSWASFTSNRATGTVSGISWVLCASGRTITYSFLDTKVNNAFPTELVRVDTSTGTGTINSDTTGSELLTTANMYKQASYNDWDFVDTWQINEDESYPYFQAPYPVQSPAPAE